MTKETGFDSARLQISDEVRAKIDSAFQMAGDWKRDNGVWYNDKPVFVVVCPSTLEVDVTTVVSNLLSLCLIPTTKNELDLGAMGKTESISALKKHAEKQSAEITKIYLNDNSLTSHDVSQISVLLFSFVKLKQVDVSFNNLCLDDLNQLTIQFPMIKFINDIF